MKGDFQWFDICIRAENSKFEKARKKVNYTLGSVCWDNSSQRDSCAGVTGRDHRWRQVNQMKWNKWKKENGSLKSKIKTSCFGGKHNKWDERERKGFLHFQHQETLWEGFTWALVIGSDWAFALLNGRFHCPRSNRFPVILAASRSSPSFGSMKRTCTTLRSGIGSKQVQEGPCSAASTSHAMRPPTTGAKCLLRAFFLLRNVTSSCSKGTNSRALMPLYFCRDFVQCRYEIRECVLKGGIFQGVSPKCVFYQVLQRKC